MLQTCFIFSVCQYMFRVLVGWGIYPLKHRLLVSVFDTLDIHCTMYHILIFNLPLSKFLKLHM